jgi:protein TonB
MLSLGEMVSMGRLESGLLLFETPQGLVHVELSFKERLALLWTFRNFRRLSTPLLNARENALVNTLYRSRARVLSSSYDPSIVIGVVEDFEPSMEVMAPEVVPQKIVTQKIDLQTIVAQRNEAQKAVAQKVLPRKTDAPLAPKKEPQPKVVVMERVEIAPKSRPVSSAPKVAWSTVAMARLATAARLVTFKPVISQRVVARLATTVGAVSLCIVSVVAWHRIEAVPGSQAHNRPQIEQVSSITPASAPIAEPVAAPVSAAPSAAAQLVADPDAPIKPTTVSPTTISADIPAATSPAATAPADMSVAAVPAAAAARVVLNPTQRIRVHNAVPTRNLPLSIQDSGIQATRPPLRYVYPDYSDVHARGVVALTAGLDSDGKVRTVKVVTGNRALAAAAVRAVRQWRYRPYLKDGQPVATETNIMISFISNDAISMSFPPSIPVTR